MPFRTKAQLLEDFAGGQPINIKMQNFIEELFEQINGGAFLVDRNAVDQTGGDDAAVNVIQFNNELWDSQGWFDPATYRFTPRVSGLYLFFLSASVANGASGETPQALVTKNGSVSNGGPYFASGGLNDAAHVVQTMVPYSMNGLSDYVTGSVWLPTGVTVISGGGSTYFGGFRMAM